MITPPDDIWIDPTDEMIEAAATRLIALAGDGPQVLDISWPTQPENLPDEKLAFLMAYWLTLERHEGTGLPRQDKVDCLDLVPTLGNVMLLDIEREGFDARYRVYGTKIAAHASRDWTGWSVSDMNRETQTPAALLYRSGYRAVYRQKAPLYAEHASPRWVDVRSWRRLILPLADESGACSRFLVGNVSVGQRILSDEEMADQKRRLHSG